MKQKKSRKLSNACPLDNPKLDIVPESSHLAGVCLCQFCKCGKHICTKDRHLQAQYLSDSFNTSYESHYTKMHFDVPYIVHPKPYHKNTQKMDFVTTNSIHYQPYSLQKEEKQKVNSFAPAKNTLLSTTAYSYYYPDWGKNEILYEKGWHAPVRSVEIPFRGETSYSKEFKKIDHSRVQSIDPKKFQACQSHISISPKDSFNPRTTYKEKMKDYSQTKMNTHVKVLTPKAHMTPAINNHYVTSTDRFFKPSTNSYIDPRKLRLSLLSRSSIS